MNSYRSWPIWSLNLCGADLVLGVQWLKSLGPVLTNYNDLTMKFLHSGRVVELKGDTNFELCAISPPNFVDWCKLMELVHIFPHLPIGSRVPFEPNSFCFRHSSNSLPNYPIWTPLPTIHSLTTISTHKSPYSPHSGHGALYCVFWRYLDL